MKLLGRRQPNALPRPGELRGRGVKGVKEHEIGVRQPRPRRDRLGLIRVGVARKHNDFLEVLQPLLQPAGLPDPRLLVSGLCEGRGLRSGLCLKGGAMSNGYCAHTCSRDTGI